MELLAKDIDRTKKGRKTRENTSNRDIVAEYYLKSHLNPPKGNLVRKHTPTLDTFFIILSLATYHIC